MKKTLLLTVLFLTFFLRYSTAQTFNKTYGVTNNDLTGRCIVPLPADSCIFYTAYSDSLNAQRLLLVKTDHDGNVLIQKFLEKPFFDHRIIETWDDGIVLAAITDSLLYVAKFDNSLNQVWAKQINLAAVPASMETITVDIDRMTDPFTGIEHYYVLCGSPTFLPSYLWSDMAISVADVDQYGQVIWHKKYIDVNRATGPAYGVYDIPRSITAIDSPSRSLIIAGTRLEFDTTGFVQRLFFMRINHAGQITAQYKAIQTEDVSPFEPEAVWDNHRQLLACTYTENNTTFSGVPNNNSGIGVMTLTANLNVQRTRYFWHDCYNSGVSITMNRDSNYVVGCHVSTCDQTKFVNPALLELKADTLMPLNFTRYNDRRLASNVGFHHTDIDDYHYLIPTPHGNLTTDFTARIIKTDPNGRSCGDRQFSITPIDEVIQQQTYTYMDSLFHDTAVTYIPEQFVSIYMTDCANSGSPSTYRTSAPYEGELTISVYPTLVTDKYAPIHCEITTAEETTVTAIISNMLGQQISSQAFRMQSGATTVDIECNNMKNGLNIIRFVENGKTKQTVKLNVIN